MCYSHEYRRPHGVYLSVDAPDEIETRLRSIGKGPEDVDLIVVAEGLVEVVREATADVPAATVAAVVAPNGPGNAMYS